MSKLLDQKNWLTIQEAARYLSRTEAFGEEVTNADVLRFALDGALKISVNFVNSVPAILGKLVEYESKDAPTMGNIANGLLDGSIEMVQKILYVSCHRSWGGNNYVLFGGKVTRIYGVWDLTMKGAEVLHLNNEFLRQIGGPPNTSICLNGMLVERSNGQIYQVLEFLDEGVREEVKLNLQDSEAKINTRPGRIDLSSLSSMSVLKVPPTSMPALGWPKDAMFVVRREALMAYLASIKLDEAESLATDEDETPKARYERVVAYVNNASSGNKTKITAFKELAEIEGCGVENIKRIYYSKDSRR